MQRIIISCKFNFESFNKGENPIHKIKQFTTIDELQDALSRGLK